MRAKHALYQLSYPPPPRFFFLSYKTDKAKFLRVMRFELIPSAWKAENLPLIYTRGKFTVAEHQSIL